MIKARASRAVPGRLVVVTALSMVAVLGLSASSMASPWSTSAATPHVASVNPSRGCPGTTVMIKGSGFGDSRGSLEDPSYVSFDHCAATEYPRWTETEIKAIIPPEATTGPVRVVVGGVESNSDVPFTVTFAVFFAEGTVRPDFETYFCLQNPGENPADVTLTYMKGDGTTAMDQVTVAPTSRATVTPRATLGTGEGAAYDFSTRVECTNGQQIVAERPMYFNYQGKWTGGHNVVGAAPSTTFFFAEGTVRPDFETYLTLLPLPVGKTDSTVTITYMLGNGSTETQEVPVKANTRTTIRVKDRLGEGDDAAHDFSMKLECPTDMAEGTRHLLFDQMVAERPMYFNYEGMWTGGHDVAGACSPASTFYFAEGTARPDFETYFSIQNPGSEEAEVRITYMKGDGKTVAQSLAISPNSRATVRAKDRLGEGNDPAHDFSAEVECTNGQQIVAERPMYFNYQGKWTGGHNVVGFAPAP